MSNNAARYAKKTHRKGRSDHHPERELRGMVQEVDNIKYLDMVSKFAIYQDQSISTNVYWSKKDLDEEGRFPIRKLIKVIIHANKIGMKSLYYSNYIMDENEEKPGCEGGGCAV